MGSVDSADFLARFMALWNSKDVASLVQLYTEDAVMEDPTLPAPIQGREAIQGYYRSMFAAYREAAHGVLRSAASGQELFFEWWFPAIPPGGSSTWEWRGVSIFTLGGGQIARDVSYWVDNRPT